MRSPITSNHFSDPEGNPAGGITFGNGFTIGWQHGPLGRGEQRRNPNGAFVEDIIAAAADRLKFYQSGNFPGEHNAKALAHLTDALAVLNERTADRERRSVEGANEQ